MIRLSAIVGLALTGLYVPAAPVLAASFDCVKASTPFEHAICENNRLSLADERLARTYATASGGLSEAATTRLRADQRSWLSFAQRACNDDVEPLTSGRYDEDGVQCLVSLFNTRSRHLEASRMIDGLRFYPIAEYAAAPDPDAEPGSSWMVGQHEMMLVQLDEDLPYAQAFNALVQEEGELMQGGGGEVSTTDGGTDTANTIKVNRVSGSLITLDVSSYWYGHGAAHGNYLVSYLHFLPDEQRWLLASDLFDGKKWQQALLDLAVDALQEQHGENLMLDSTEYIADSVINPQRWDLSNPYGLIIQFQPYEVSAYAYGAPTVTIPWEDLQDYFSETGSRYGYAY